MPTILSRQTQRASGLWGLIRCRFGISLMGAISSATFVKIASGCWRKEWGPFASATCKKLKSATRIWLGDKRVGPLLLRRVLFRPFVSSCACSALLTAPILQPDFPTALQFCHRHPVSERERRSQFRKRGLEVSALAWPVNLRVPHIGTQSTPDTPYCGSQSSILPGALTPVQHSLVHLALPQLHNQQSSTKAVPPRHLFARRQHKCTGRPTCATKASDVEAKLAGRLLASMDAPKCCSQRVARAVLNIPVRPVRKTPEINLSQRSTVDSSQQRPDNPIRRHRTETRSNRGH